MPPHDHVHDLQGGQHPAGAPGTGVAASPGSGEEAVTVKQDHTAVGRAFADRALLAVVPESHTHAARERRRIGRALARRPREALPEATAHRANGVPARGSRRTPVRLCFAEVLAPADETAPSAVLDARD